MAPPNLTRVDAARRAALLDVAELRPAARRHRRRRPPGETTFAARTTVAFTCREPGADSSSTLVAETCTRPPSTASRSTCRATPRTAASPCPAWPSDNELTVDADRLLLEHRRGPAPLRRPRGRRRSTSTRSSSPPTPSGCSPASTSPTSRPRSRCTVTAPADWKVVSNAAAHGRGRPGRASRAPLRHHRADLSTYLVALVAGPYAEWRDEHADEPARSRWASTAAPRSPSTSTPTAVHRDQAGLRLLPPQLRLPVPVRQVRPAVRAGVQRRRDGERRRGDVPGGLRLPQPGHPLDLRAPRRDRAARDGAHVVRRPGHHALVGRPVAQRVVRDLRERALPGGGHRVHRGLDDVRQRREDLGVPPGPAALDAPDRRRHPRPAGRRGQLRRDHLRQGRVGAQAAGGLRRAGAVPRRAAARTSRRTSGATPPSTTCSARWSRRPGATCRAGARSGCAPRGSTCCGRSFELDADGRVRPVRRRAGRRPARRGRAAHAPDRGRDLRRRRRRPDRAHAPRRGGRRGRAHGRARAGRAVPAASWCWSTTTT